MLLFLLLLIVFKEFSNNRELILGTFFSLWPNDFFLETKLAIKDGHDFCVALYTFSFISLEISRSSRPGCSVKKVFLGEETKKL